MAVRALEGGGPGRGRHLGRVVGLVALLALLATGSAFLVGRPLAGARGGVWPLDQVSATRASTAPGAISTPRASATPAARSGSQDTLAAAQAIVAPASPPVRLVIPALGVNAQVAPLGPDAAGRMATP